MVDEEEDLCVICLDASPTVLLEACKHKCMCQACFDLLLLQKAHKCPLCRADIDKDVDDMMIFFEHMHIRPELFFQPIMPIMNSVYVFQGGDEEVIPTMEDVD
jgi:Zinc finger, C3HC4 type (RING finger)